MIEITMWNDGAIYVGLVSGWYKVIALFTDDDSANDFLKKNDMCGVLCQEGKVIIVALNKDCGLKELPQTKYDVYGNPI